MQSLFSKINKISETVYLKNSNGEYMFLKKMIWVVMCLSLTACQLAASRKSDKLAKNAIFFIGDGMGPAQMTAGRLYKGGSFYKMNYEKFEFTGFSKTYSSDNYTTDSAAGATALAAGVKSYNGSISMSDPKWEKSKKARELETLADLAKAQGKSVGIITTTRITHATPACYFAHVLNRNSDSEIAQQRLESHVDLWIGRGRNHFFTKSIGEKRSDGRNILNLMKEKGAYTPSSLDQIKKIENLDNQILALFSDSHIEYKQTGKSEAKLDDMVKEAIRLLSQNPKGYFLLVEGGRVDHASHINHEERMMAEMVDLDDAIGYAMDNVNLDDTLIVLTADHETAGVAISGYGPHKSAEGKNILGKTTPRGKGETIRPILSWATGPGQSLSSMHSAAHTAVDVPIGAIGVGASQFTGWMDNTQIALNIAEAMGMSFSSKVNENSMEILSKLHKEKIIDSN